MKSANKTNNSPQTFTLDETFGELSAQEKKIANQEVKYYFLVQTLRNMRAKYGFTQQLLAKKARIPRTTISKIESGNYNPTVETLTLIAHAFGKELKISFE